MSYFYTLFGGLVLFLTFQQSKESGPYSWADNVCSIYLYETAQTSYRTNRWAYEDYYKRCGIWGWSRCKKTRRYRVYYYATRTTSVQRTYYYCCPGWSSSGRYCSKPICTNACIHGNCVSPNKCSCYSGWHGSRCQYDMNECSSNKSACQQVCVNTQGSYQCGCYRGYRKTGSKSCRDFDECTNSPCRCASSFKACGARCLNTQGSFRCSCGTGFKLVGNKSMCTDINECSGNVCQQTCINTIGSYWCSCGQGYQSRKNGTYCDDIDECKTNNGNCEQICTNNAGSRQCACREGYRLEENGIACQDIDECSTNNPCQHYCTNRIGRFTCYCRKGYQLNPDNRTCSDVNECQSRKIHGLLNAKYSLSNCEHTCFNTKGSYTCGCRSGFEIQVDKRSCKDTDECTTGTHQCSQTCINTRGSYRCSCVTGYELNKDGKSCRALFCPTLVQQPHGTMTCTGMATKGKCSFTCNHGYYMEGPSSITCMPTLRWSGRQATCKGGIYGLPLLKPPVNAILSLPCFRTYGFSCSMRCEFGYYHTGSSKITCDLTADKRSVAWKNDFQCHHVRSCKPNPCRHGGTCTPLTSKDFKCDCSNTGYEGKQCEHGVINVPLFPKLKTNLQSSPLSFQARPSKEIEISIQSDENVVAQPSKIKLFKLKNKAAFTLESKQPGLKVISFSVRGESAKDYMNPAETVIFVSPETPNKNNIFTQIPMLTGELPVGCYMKNADHDMFKCPVQLSSTHPWKQTLSSKQLSTKGLVHLITEKGSLIPLSLFGVDFLSKPYSEGLLNRVKHISQLSKNVRVKKINSEHTCESTTLDVPQMMEIVEHDVFTASFLGMFSKSAPAWLQIQDKTNSSCFDMRNIHANIGSKSKTCTSLFKSSSVITYEPTIGSTITLEEDITLPDEKGFCYAIDFCTSDVGFTLPRKSTKAIKSSALFQDMKNAGWDIDLTGAVFPGNGKSTVTIGQRLWNGRHLVHLGSQEYEVILKGKMKTKLENKENIKISLDYQGDVFVDTTNISEVLHYGFERNITGILKGRAALNMTTTIFNKQLNIELPSEEVVGKSILGVSTLNQGIFLKWKNVPRLLQGTPLQTVIRPAMDQPVFVSLEHHVQGGKQTSIVNLSDYDNKLMLLGLLLPQLKGIMKNPQMSVIAKKENIKRWRGFIDELNTLVGDIRSVIGTLPSKNNMKFSLLISQLRKKLRDVKFLCKIIESTAKIKMPTTARLLIDQVNQLIINLPHVPNGVFERSPVSNYFHGFKMLFQGNICSKRLCFEGLNVTLESSRSKTNQAQNYPSITIQGKNPKTFQLGKLMSLKNGKKVLLKALGKAETSILTFNPTLHFMGVHKGVSCEIKQDTLSFNTSVLLYGKHEAFINVSAKTDVSDWSLLQYHVSGRLRKNSSLRQQLQRKINSHIKDLAQKATKRIEKAQSVARESKQTFESFRQTLTEKLKALELLAEKKKQLINTRRKAKAEYKYQRIYVHDNYDQEEDRPQDCKLNQCEWGCSQTKLCTYESKKLQINVARYNCAVKENKVSKDRIVQKSEIAYYEKETFVLVEKTNCGQRTYEKILGPIGEIVGTYTDMHVVGKIITFPLVALLTGPLLLFAYLANSIFGCEQTYEMVPGPKVLVSYTKVWNQRESYTVTERTASCSSYNWVKENGYQAPQLTCKSDTCIKIMNAKCVKENNECYNRKQLYRLNGPNLKDEQEKSQNFDRLSGLGNRLEIATIDLYKAEAKYDKMLEETKLAKAQLNQLELGKNRTKAAIPDVKAFPSTKLGLRLSKLLEKTRIERTVYISDFTFDLTFTDRNKRQIPITIKVKSIDGKTKDLSALFDFDKEEASLQKIVTKIIKDLYEEKRSARRKRSIPEELYNKINNTEDNQDVIQSLKNQDLCLESKKANEFYKEILKSLEDLVDARKQVERVNRDDIEKLTSVYQTFENVTANDNQSGSGTAISQEMATSYQDYIGSIIEDKRNVSMMSWNETLVSWRAFLEVLTKEESFLNCVGAQDCLIDIGEDLDELYFYESDFARANDIRMVLSNVTMLLIDLISQNFTVEEFRYKISDLRYLLLHSEDTNVLCGRKPEITFVSNAPKVVIENETITLFCNATSDTKVTYQWIHNNESVIQSRNGSLTIRKANISHAGSYKCKAINRKGFAISNVTIITINSKPKITEHPNDTKVYAKDGKGLLLVCNATGDPEPDIEWFFISRFPNSSEVKVYNDNGSFLYYEKPSQNHTGYYYCVARNIHGLVQSRKAKVWVLNMSPGEPRLGTRINVTKTCKSQRGLSSCGNVHSGRDLSHIKKALAMSLSNPLSKVIDIKVVPNGLQTATVSFLYASKETIKEVIHEPILNPVVESFARKRKTLVNGLQTWYQKLKNESSSIVINNNEEIFGDADSLTVWVTPPGCSRGQGPHSNGFMCYNCPPGTYGNADGQCTPCPIKTYQYEQGQTKCMSCQYGFTTKRKGALSPVECYDARPLPPRNLQANAKSSTILQVSWLAPKGDSNSISSYLIRYRDSTGRLRTKRVPKTVTTWTLTGLKSFTDYHIAVYAMNSYGERASRIIAKTRKDECSPGMFKAKDGNCRKCPPKTYQPQAGQKQCIPCIHSLGPLKDVEGRSTCEEAGSGKPRSFLSFSPGPDSLKLLWWKPKTGQVSHYELEYWFTNQTLVGTIPALPGNKWTYQLRGLLKYTSYRLKLYAVINNRRRKPAEITVRTMDDVPGRSPTITSVTGVSATAINVKWQQLPISQRNGIILGYVVYIKRNSDPMFKKQKIDGGSELSAVLANLKEDTLYCIKMTAFTRKGAYSNWQRNGCKYARTLRKGF